MPLLTLSELIHLIREQIDIEEAKEHPNRELLRALYKELEELRECL